MATPMAIDTSATELVVTAFSRLTAALLPGPMILSIGVTATAATTMRAPA